MRVDKGLIRAVALVCGGLAIIVPDTGFAYVGPGVGFALLGSFLTQRWMAAGQLPNLSKLAEQGSFSPLRTTCPAIPPVAWSSFMTGVDPACHNIFDFLSRDLRTYKPKLSSSEIRDTDCFPNRLNGRSIKFLCS